MYEYGICFVQEFILDAIVKKYEILKHGMFVFEDKIRLVIILMTNISSS